MRAANWGNKIVSYTEQITVEMKLFEYWKYCNYSIW